MSSNFLSILEKLAANGVDFVIVGGFAGVVHGCTYVTQDIDICCDFKSENLLALQKALADIHPVHRMTPNRKKLELTEKNSSRFKNLYLDTDIGPLDCFSFIDGLGYYKKVKRASELIKIKRAKLRILNINALIKAKKAMNRPRDRQVILQLEFIKKLKNKSKK